MKSINPAVRKMLIIVIVGFIAVFIIMGFCFKSIFGGFLPGESRPRIITRGSSAINTLWVEDAVPEEEAAPGPDAEDYRDMGYEAYANGDWAATIENFDQAFSLQNGGAFWGECAMHFMSGQAALNLNDQHLARVCFDMAITCDSTNAEYYYTRGCLYRDMQFFSDKSYADWIRAIELDRDYVLAQPGGADIVKMFEQL